MSRHRDEHIDLCAAWAVGSIGADDLSELERHLAEGCPECERACAEFGVTSLALAHAAPAARPSAEARARLQRAIGAGVAPLAATAGFPASYADRPAAQGPEPASGRAPDRVPVLPLETRRARVWPAWAAGAIAAALAVATGLVWMQSQRLEAELASERTRIAELERQAAEEQRWADLMKAPDARVAMLAPTPSDSAGMHGRVVYDPNSRLALVVMAQAAPKAGKAYELWAIRGATPHSLGLMQPDAQGNAVMKLENAGDPGDLNAFAVSLEPEGGSPNPTAPSGPVVLLGQLGTWPSSGGGRQ